MWPRHVEPAFGPKALSAITTSAIRSWYAELHRQRRATAEGAYRLLRQLLNAAVEDGRRSPTRVESRVRAGTARPSGKVATLAEVEAIVAALPEHLRLAVLLATYAGLRRSELLGLHRRDLDPLHRSVTVAGAATTLATARLS